MALNAAILGYEYFPDPTKGRPVYFGSVYVGVVDLDPQIPANQLTIQYRQEDGTLVPATQPVLTGAGGIPLYNGSPVQIIVDGAYSMKVLNSSGAQVYYRADSTDNEPDAINPLDILSDLRANTDNSINRVSLAGHTTKGDGGGGEFWLDTSDTTTADADGVNIIDAVAPRIGTWKRIYSGAVNALWFGLQGGANDDTAAVQAWLDTPYKSLAGAPGTYKITSTLISAVADRIITGNNMELAPTNAVGTALLDLRANNQQVEKFILQADADAQCGGIFIGAFDDCEINNNLIRNFDGSGGTDTGSAILCSSQGKNHSIHHNRVIDCHFSHAALQYGSIHCNAGGSVIEDNIILDCQQTGISVAGGSSGGSHYIQILNNTMVGKLASATSGGVNVDGFTIGADVSGNRIRNMAVEVILISGSLAIYGAITTDVTINNNRLYECVLNEIVLQGGTTGDIKRVLIEGNKGYRSTNTNQALVMDSADDVDVFGNTFYGHDSGYIVIGVCSRHNVTGNTFINQTNTAIQCAASESIYTNNRVWGDGANTIGLSFNAINLAGKLSIHGNGVRNCDVGIQGTFNPSSPVYVARNNLGGNNTDLNYTGELADSSSDNSFDAVLAGEATLVAGVATIVLNTVLAGDRIELDLKTPSGTRGALYVNSITAASGFAVKSTDVADTSVIYWRIIR